MVSERNVKPNESVAVGERERLYADLCEQIARIEERMICTSLLPLLRRCRAALEASHAPVPDDVRVFLSRVIRTVDQWDGPFPHPFYKLITPAVRAAAGTTPEPRK